MAVKQHVLTCGWSYYKNYFRFSQTVTSMVNQYLKSLQQATNIQHHLKLQSKYWSHLQCFSPQSFLLNNIQLFTACFAVFGLMCIEHVAPFTMIPIWNENFDHVSVYHKFRYSSITVEPLGYRQGIENISLYNTTCSHPTVMHWCY